jgi:phospholipid transport system substrate-binding protein
MSQISTRVCSQIPFTHELGIRLTWAMTMGMLALLVLTGAASAATELTPTESVRNTITEVIHILDNQELKQPGRSEERRRLIEQTLRHRISYEHMAKHSLGAPWAGLSDAERQEFVGLFVELLRDAFANRITEYSGEQVLYLSEQREGSVAKVSTILMGQKVDTAIEFRLLNLSGDWLVYDAVVDGSSIINNYRAQFAGIVRDLSYAGLVSKMKQNTLIVKAFEKTRLHE